MAVRRLGLGSMFLISALSVSILRALCLGLEVVGVEWLMMATLMIAC
jgi:hypothetical protein